MNFQYYEALMDKSKQYLLYLAQQIEPKFTIGELKMFFEDINKGTTKSNSGSKKGSSTGFVKIGEDYDTMADLSKLTEDELKALYQFFISREINDKLAVKWRFYQHFKYIRGILIENVLINRNNAVDQLIDFIIDTNEGIRIVVLCFDVFGINNYSKAIESLKDFIDNQKTTPNRVIFATNKTYRNLSIAAPLKLNSTEIKPELWIEWIDINRPFNGEDMIIINDSKLKVAGFNFTSIEDLLDYVYEFSDGGQVSIFKQMDFFSGESTDNPEVDMIWKGIMLKEGSK